jgi:hypothetical protein
MSTIVNSLQENIGPIDSLPLKSRISKYLLMILLPGIQLTHVQRYRGLTVKIVCFVQFFFTFHEANTCVAFSNA